MRFSSLLFLSLVFTAYLLTPAYGELIFYDSVAIKDMPQMLRAETKGRIFKKGGEIVEFFIDKKPFGKSLSGGDGSAFREFTPAKAGLYKISVISGKDRDDGFLLSLEKGTGIVFIDVEGSLYILSSKGPSKESKKVIRAISKRFPITYLQTFVVGAKSIKEWLKKNGFVEAPVLSWKDGNVFQELSKKGLKIKFIIGSANVIESAKEYKPKAFSFEETEGAEEAKDWEDIGKKLKIIK